VSDPLVHPLTGEIVPEVLPALVDAEKAVDRDARKLYGFRSELRKTIAELRGVAVLPPRHRRTEVQRRVASCPRCGERLDERKAA
jgi:hypothetical protein